MAATTPEPHRDTVGRFATQEHTAPELALAEVYLDDDSGAADFDIDAFYDINHDPVASPSELADDEWLDRERDARDALSADEFFAQPEPDFEAGTVNILDRSAWGTTPF